MPPHRNLGLWLASPPLCSQVALGGMGFPRSTLQPDAQRWIAGCVVRSVVAHDQAPALMPSGPGQAAEFVHFTGRPAGRPVTPLVPPEIRSMSATQRLQAILDANAIRGFPPFGAEPDQPMVCFSASPTAHLEYLLGGRGWQPWGVIIRRQWLYDRGGAPVRHLRNEDFDARARRDRPWSVRLSTDEGRFSDWTDELEWRAPVPPADPRLLVLPGDVVALLVGEPNWEPASLWYQCWDGQIRHRDDLDMLTDARKQAIAPLDEWATVPRWWWDRDAGVVRKAGDR
jgi:hypothetical protein